MTAGFRPTLCMREFLEHSIFVGLILIVGAGTVAFGQSPRPATEAPAITVPPRVSPAVVPAEGKNGKVLGVEHKNTGWRRFDTPYHISFLLPGSADYEASVERTSPFPLLHFTYGYSTDNLVFSVEYFEGFDVAARMDPSALTTALDRSFAGLKRNLASSGITFGEVTATSLNGVAGRVSTIAATGTDQTGRAHIFVTPARMFVVIGLVKRADVNRGDLERFFSSVKIAD